LGNVLLTWYLLLAASFILIGAIGLPPSLRLPLDLSYGIYIYAWPIQQLSAMITSNFWIALLFSILFTLLLALLSTLFIELPAQRFKRDLRRRTGAEEDRAVLTAPTKCSNKWYDVRYWHKADIPTV
ncbi:MAG: hypothetical protein WBE53_10005, partial [Pseudolabrys sp.]